ncbi:MAG: hypothetical protein N2999_07635 [Proteobacteria bacterium]|nr:hypothetical protein [Pseudomonadota bacterium]
MRKFFYLIICLVSLLPELSLAQPNIAVKLYNSKDDSSQGVANFQGGNLWLLKNKKELVYYINDEIRTFLFQDNKLNEKSFFRLDENELVNLTKLSAKDDIKDKKVQEKIGLHWDLLLNNLSISSYTVDGDNTLILSDKAGDLYFYNIVKKEFIGRLNLPKGEILSVHSLKNGSIIVIYKNGDILFIEKKVYPLLSFFQTLRDTYQIRNKINAGSNTVKFMDENEQYGEFSLLIGHRVLSIYKTPELSLVRTIKDDKFVECACFFENKLIYSVIEEGKIEGAFSFHKHFNVLSNFYEKKKNIIPSVSGSKFCYVTGLSSIKVYNLASERLIGEIGINVKDINEIKFSPDDKYILIANCNNNINIYIIE